MCDFGSKLTIKHPSLIHQEEENIVTTRV